MPKFEGEDLDGNTVVVRQFKGPISIPLARGEEVQVTIRGRVVAVTVREDRKTGRLTRDHEVRITEITEGSIEG